MTDLTAARASRAVLAALLLSASGIAHAQSVPIVQPGAPGKASKTLSAEQATKLAQASYTAEDATFMQHMIVHHQQAVEMAKLVKDRTNTPEIVTIAGRIESSQADEITFMQTWLKERGEPLPAIAGSVPSLVRLPSGCAFASRCPMEIPACRTAVPELEQVGPDRRARCIRWEDV